MEQPHSLLASRGPIWPILALAFLAGCASSVRPHETSEESLRPVAFDDADSADPEKPPEGHGSGHGDGHGEGHGAGTQAFNLFLGGSNEFGDRDGVTGGVDYEYRLSEKWGIGGFAEFVGGMDRSFAIGPQGYWHAIAELVLVAGPGFERVHDEWGAIFRFGGFYEIPIGDEGWVISPALFYDVTEHEDLFIYGLNFGYLW